MRTLIAICVMAAGIPLSVSGQAPPAVQQIAFDYSALYEALNPSIVKVHADGGHGSGFLVSADGLIATNHHVVRNSSYVAVQFAEGRKVLANVVTLDPRYDVAVLKINRSVVGSVKPLTLLPEEREREVKAGVPVLAFGSPLSQTFLMTQGIIAKVEENVVLGDFLIQGGNSGGPLVNLRGEVVGINTFAEQSISGAVRVGTLRRVLTSNAVRTYDQPDPAATLLPTPSERYPTEALKEKIAGDPLDLKNYQLDGGKFTVTAITPVMLGKVQIQQDVLQARNRFSRRGKKVNDPTWREVDAPFYEWHRNAQYLDNVVTFEIKPDFGSTTGSIWAAVLSGAAAGLAGTPVTPTHNTMEFKAEFQDFKLYKDGQLIQPIHPGRSITEASFQGPYVSFVDEAYSGMYSYAPEVFNGGRQFRIEVYDAREPGKPHRVLNIPEDDKLFRQIRRDFANISPQSTTQESPLPEPASSPASALPRGESTWATSLAGISAHLQVQGDTIVLRLTGEGPMAGVDAILRRSGEAYSGTYLSPLCSTMGMIELRQIETGWHGSIEAIDCPSGRVKRKRTGLLLTPR